MNISQKRSFQIRTDEEKEIMEETRFLFCIPTSSEKVILAGDLNGHVW